MMAVLTGLALGSFWMLEVMRRNNIDIAPKVDKGEPDYIVNKFTLVRMSASGHARYRISGEKLWHYPENDSFEIQQPRLINLAQDQSPMTLRSDRAVVENIARKVHMYRSVKADRPAFAGHSHFELDTEYLMVLPDDDIMQTDKAVKVQVGMSRLTGVGMFANNATREFRLAKNVQGTFQTAVH
jgi:lipopolysaccharide export system protein LptC